MINPLKWLNYSAIVLPFSLEKVFLEPDRFVRQVRQRVFGYENIRSSALECEQNEASDDSSLQLKVGESLRRRIDVGDYLGFESAYSGLSVFEKFRYFNQWAFVRSKRRQLAFKIYEGVAPTASSRHVRLLYFVNNALPYTQSGYTIRTAALASALEDKVESLSIVSRLGYPLVIGKIPKSHHKLNDLSILLPKFWPFGVQKQYQMAKNLLIKLCVKQQISVIQTTSDFKNAALVSDVAYELGIPWIYEIRGEPHNTWLSRFRGPSIQKAKESYLFQRSAYQELEAARKANAVVVLSSLARERLVQSGIPESKVLLAPNAIESNMVLDLERSSEIRDQLGILNSTVVGTVSSLVAYEGLETLIRALPLLGSNVELVLVGDGEERSNLQRLCESMGISDRVHFPGKQPASEMQGWYSIFDVFVVPRIDSSVTRNVTPIKPLNALALGIPVVCSDLPALKEVTGGFARFVKPDSPSELAKGISEAIDDPEAFLADRPWLEERTWEANATKLAKLYKELTNYS